MSNDSTKKTIAVALGVCLVCSVLVSTAAVTLKSIQDRNKELDKLKNILTAGDLYQEGVDIKAVYAERIQPELIDLETGQILPESEYTDKLDPAKFDIKQMAKDPEYSKAIPSESDKADITRMPKTYERYSPGWHSRRHFPLGCKTSRSPRPRGRIRRLSSKLSISDL